MSNTLATLLQAKQPQFSMMIHHMERAAGLPGVDVRLQAELTTKIHKQMRALGLDPHDTTGKEFYQGLKSMATLHDTFLQKQVGVTPSDTPFTVYTKVAGFIDGLQVPRQAWVMKQSTAKRLLKVSPPKKVMKQLGYRSVDSLIKRESVVELFAAARVLESDDWQRWFTDKYAQLSPQDFETRDITVVVLDPERWHIAVADAHQKRHNISHLKELGAVIVVPVDVKMPVLTLVTTALILHYIHEIRLYSAYFKLKHVQGDFAQIIVETLQRDPGRHVTMAGYPVHWRVLHRYYGRTDAVNHPELFEPHVMPEDLHWRSVEDILFRIEPALQFWYGYDYVGGKFGESVVSCNLLDIAIAAAGNIPYGAQPLYHFRESLWNELYVRYVGQPILEKQILRQLED